MLGVTNTEERVKSLIRSGNSNQVSILMSSFEEKSTGKNGVLLDKKISRKSRRSRKNFSLTNGNRLLQNKQKQKVELTQQEQNELDPHGQVK